MNSAIFVQDLLVLNKIPTVLKYNRNNNSQYYSSDSNSKTTASCLFEGSELVSTPAKSEKEEVAPCESISSFRLTKLTNLESLNPKVEYEGPSTSRFNGVVIPKIFFSKTTDLKPKVKKNVKRINKLNNLVIFIKNYYLGMLN